MSRCVLDASALLALFNEETGAGRVADLIDGGGAAVNTVNLSEVVAKRTQTGTPEAIIRQAIDHLPIEIVPFTTELAYAAGLLRPATRRLGLSLGDRACLALAQHLSLPAVTADRMWAELSLGVPVEVIR